MLLLDGVKVVSWWWFWRFEVAGGAAESYIIGGDRLPVWVTVYVRCISKVGAAV